MFLFPYNKIDEGSKVVLYGFGNVGQVFFEQLQFSGYADIVFVIDKDYIQKKNSLVEIYPVDIITVTKSVNYDYIVVSVEKKEMADILINNLLQHGVERNKIIWQNYRVRRIHCNDKAYEIIKDNPKYIKFLIRDIKLLGKGRRDFYSPLVEEIKTKDDDELTKWIDNVLNQDLEPLEEIVFFNILYDAYVLKPTSMQHLLKRVINFNSELVNLGLSFLYAPLLHKECMYDEYYMDWRILLKKISENYNLVSKHKTVKNNDYVRKVAFIVLTLRPVFEGYFGLAIKQINMMAENGYEVGVFVADTFAECEDEISLQSPILYELTYKHEKELKKCLRQNVKVYFRYERYIKERMQGLIDDVDFFSPDLIIDNSDEALPQGYCLMKHYPVLYYPARGHGISAFCFRYIARKKERRLICSKAAEILPDNKIIEANFSGLTEVLIGGRYTREMFGFNPNDFIIITVSARLDAVLDAELIRETSVLLKKYTDIRWVIVGERPHKYPPGMFEMEKSGNMIFWGWEKDLNSLYEICDVLLCPRQFGGGVSIRTAMYFGLPVVLLKDKSDGTYSIGEENAISGDYTNLIEYIEHLYKDRHYCDCEGEKMRLRIRKALHSDCDRWIDVINRCYEEYWNEREEKDNNIVL